MRARCLTLIIGYLLGNIMTAEFVARVRAGKSAREIGSGNPGMANMMTNFGFKTGILVLAGDTGKTLIACLLSQLLFPEGGRILIMYAGLGACIGHNYPVWMKGKGGKGVAVTCMVLLLYAPFWGLAADVLGMVVVFMTGYLPLGAILIPLVFLFPAFGYYGKEAGVITLLLAVLMVVAHRGGLERIYSKTEPRVMQIWGKNHK